MPTFCAIRDYRIQFLRLGDHGAVTRRARRRTAKVTKARCERLRFELVSPEAMAATLRALKHFSARGAISWGEPGRVVAAGWDPRCAELGSVSAQPLG